MNTARTTVPVITALALALALTLAGCGSTKVYTADKTMIHQGNLYNLAQVQELGSRVDVALPGGAPVDPVPADKREIRSLLDEHDSLTVTTLLLLDEKEVVYERSEIDSYSDYARQTKRFDKVRRKLADFMSNPKATQLKLD